MDDAGLCPLYLWFLCPPDLNRQSGFLSAICLWTDDSLFLEASSAAFLSMPSTTLSTASTDQIRTAVSALLLKSILTMAAAILLWSMSIVLTSLLPEFLNPRLSNIVVAIVGAITSPSFLSQKRLQHQERNYGADEIKSS